MWGEQVKLWNVTWALDISKEFIMADTKYIPLKGVSKGGSGEKGSFTLMLLCVQPVTSNDVHNLEKQERKEQLSGYKQCYTYNNQSLEVSKNMNPGLITYKKLDGRG